MALSDYEIQSLRELFTRWGYPRGNTATLLRRYYNSGGDRLDEAVISRRLSARLKQEVGLRSTSILTRREAADGTVKLLIGLGGQVGSVPVLQPGASVECVLMPSHLADRAAG